MYVNRDSTMRETLDTFIKNDVARFHMPGHKGFTDTLFGFDYDVTELSGTDDLAFPAGCIKRAQEEAARAFRAEYSFFSTCGATACVLAMFLSLKSGSKVIIPRDAHKSAHSGVALGRHVPVYVYPDYANGEYGVITAGAIENALRGEPDARAVLLTRPDYYGRCADIEAISCVCRQYGAKLLVDEAHGAHFAFSNSLPKSAAGFADMWVNSAHKTLPCPNQGAYLHLGRHSPQTDVVARALFSVHTTSPSYPVLLALDNAWRAASKLDYSAHIERLTDFAEKLPEDMSFKYTCASASDYDETRLVIDVSTRGVTGTEADKRLRDEGVYVEMSDEKRVVAITSPLDPDVWYNALLHALYRLPKGNARFEPVERFEDKLRSAMLPCEVAEHEFKYVNLREADGRVCAETVGIYPPGTATVAAGEVFSRAAVDYLLKASSTGRHLFGVRNGKVTVI